MSSTKLKLILKQKKKKNVILHCGVSENLLWGLSCEDQWNEKRRKFYIHFTTKDTAIIYLKDVRKKKKTLHIYCRYLNQVVLTKYSIAITEEAMWVAAGHGNNSRVGQHFLRQLSNGPQNKKRTTEEHLQKVRGLSGSKWKQP